ncbi:hypothetical protein MHK_000228 [Candidatus Magnetomorum sp. HK-1]|nr:hypothetical protein MHK_000228 [Candidatus Magnetomorum sp. HK-1]
MNEVIWIALIIAAAIVIIVYALKNRLSDFSLNADPKKLGASLKTHGPSGIVIQNTKQNGNKNEMNISRDNVTIDNFEQSGSKHKLDIKQENP